MEKCVPVPVCGCVFVYCTSVCMCVYAVFIKTSHFQLCLSLSSSICFITVRHPDPGFLLHLSQLRCTMGSLRPGHWSLILVLMLLLQIQPVKVQGVDPVSQKLRRLNEQVSLNETVWENSRYLRTFGLHFISNV